MGSFSVVIDIFSLKWHAITKYSLAAAPLHFHANIWKKFFLVTPCHISRQIDYVLSDKKSWKTIKWIMEAFDQDQEEFDNLIHKVKIWCIWQRTKYILGLWKFVDHPQTFAY